MVHVKFFQAPRFTKKGYQREAGKISVKLVQRLKPVKKETIEICRGDINDKGAESLALKYGEELVKRVKVEGRAQDLVENAYLDEIRNLGYEPIPERMEKWGKSFWHMFRWVSKNRKMLKYTKSGWPRLQRYKLFQTKKK
ncbi:hypothetical protein CL673_07925 [Candidatus Bathyarchaeota archaeon]|jgi:hypothetical protein|nr:hypothetical protein [Candidatus Bathyarchaeota archaeon]MDP6049335.1 hypothetical protein [Candidatus Bathyarchaeota archaeon]MDP7443235.1 hypothetical protein [Candidatus Bathyarchaeota archaeon]|tara:strand:- start:1927 stop:2346 length:420 start_codon:yes stop_codon:yes gene_type:complete